MAFHYAQFKAEYRRKCHALHINPDEGASTYSIANQRAECARQKQARAVTNWWQSVDWLAWLDVPSVESRPTERIAFILLSREYRRAIARLERLTIIDTLRFAYGQSHELPLSAILIRREATLVFVEVGHKGSGKYKAVEIAAA